MSAAPERSRGESSKIWADAPGRMKGQLRYSLDGKEGAISSAWFRGEHCNFNPTLEHLRKGDAALKYILNGWIPPAPVIEQTDRIVAFGSCFAANISSWLNERRFNVLTKDTSKQAYVVQFSDAMVTTFAILQQFEWALEGKEFHQNLWHSQDKKPQGYDESIRQQTRELFLSGDVFVITLGLSEIWYDSVTSEVFWRAIPQDEVDPSRHKFRVSSVQENTDNIKRIVEIIKKYRPNATVIITLSPIGLAATFRPVSCLTANSVSKSILRSAIDQAYRDLADRNPFFYWPSYEIVMDLFENKWMADRRHIRREIIDFIMILFERVWCRSNQSEDEMIEKYVSALFATSALPRAIPRAFRNNNSAELQRLLEAVKKKSEGEFQLVEKWLQCQSAARAQPTAGS